MKTLIAILALTVATGVMAQAAKHPDPEKLAASAKKDETNCVTKDKKGNCPTPPKSEKPTPKKVEKKADAPKAEVKK
jgi:hypothetical protein